LERKPYVGTLAQLLPNLVTCTSLAVGVSAIFMALQGRFVDGAWLVMVCVILDKLDGTLARALKAGSDLGVQLDSLADFVSFNVAPAILVAGTLTAPPSLLSKWPFALVAYSSGIVFAVAGAARLARFNCAEQRGEGLKSYFEGIPTTLAGAFFATLLVLVHKFDAVGPATYWLPPAMVLMSLMMVSGLYLPKMQRRKRRYVNWFTTFNAVAVPVLIVARQLPEYLFFLVVLYIGVGLVFANRKGVEIV